MPFVKSKTIPSLTDTPIKQLAEAVLQDPNYVAIRVGEDARCVWVPPRERDHMEYLRRGYQFVQRDEMEKLEGPNYLFPVNTRFGMISPMYTADGKVGWVDEVKGDGELLMWIEQSKYEARLARDAATFDLQRKKDLDSIGARKDVLD